MWIGKIVDSDRSYLGSALRGTRLHGPRAVGLQSLIDCLIEHHAYVVILMRYVRDDVGLGLYEAGG